MADGGALEGRFLDDVTEGEGGIDAWDVDLLIGRVAHLPVEEVVLDERDSTMLEAVARLPYRQRVVIVARYWGGWTEADIAKVQECSVMQMCLRRASMTRARVSRRTVRHFM